VQHAIDSDETRDDADQTYDDVHRRERRQRHAEDHWERLSRYTRVAGILADGAPPIQLRPSFALRRLLAVRLEALIDQRHAGVDGRMAEALLLGDQLHELIGALDVGHAVVERASGGGWTRQALGRGGVLLERHEVVRLGAELHAQIEHEIVY